MGQERRKFPRVHHPLEIQYRLCGGVTATWQPGTALNLSAAGLRFTCAESVELESTLEVGLQIPSEEACMVFGQVVWSQMQASGVSEVAVEFVKIREQQQRQIDALVEFLGKRR